MPAIELIKNKDEHEKITFCSRAASRWRYGPAEDNIWNNSPGRLIKVLTEQWFASMVSKPPPCTCIWQKTT